MARKEVIERIRGSLDKRDNIRNISVIAHVDHGKSTLTDSLIVAAGLMSKGRRGDRFMDIRDDEKKRGITIKSTSVSMVFDALPPKVKVLAKKGQWKPGDRSKKVLADKADKAEQEKLEEKLEKLEKEKLEEKLEEEKLEEEKPEVKQKKKEKSAKKEAFLINLIDSPGHVDFSSEVTAALRVTDGALVVVDCVEGVCIQTETVLRQALAERIKPVLFVNKLDRMFMELHMESEDAYQALQRSVESVNVVISTLADDLLGDATVWPQNGSVGFGSGLQGWGFTLNQMAKLWHKKFNISEKKMKKKLWGENYWDPKKKMWSTSQFTKAGRKLQRGFCLLVLDPLRTLFSAVLGGDRETYRKFIEKRHLKLPKEAQEQEGGPLLKTIMQTWLPASEALLEMVIEHCPSPIKAQKYRVQNLYSGPLDDDVAKAIRECDPLGPLVMYVAKMVPTVDKSRFYAFGRVFAGTVSAGQSVRIHGPDYTPGSKLDLSNGSVQGTVLMMGPYTETFSSFPCGTVCGLVGIDQYIVKSGTITTSPHAYNIVTMKHSVSPIVRVAVGVENPTHLSKLVTGLKRLAKSDPLIQTYLSPTGEHIIAGCGELHLQVCLRDLQEDFMKGISLKISNPVVTFRESMGTKSMVCVAKSANKLNHVHMSAQPLGDKFCDAIESGDVVKAHQSGEKENKLLGKRLVDDYGWSLTETKKIWSFGCPPDSLANVLVDVTKGVQNLQESKDSICTAFQEAVLEGVFTNEPMRGVRVNLEDLKLHSDSAHRGPRQLVHAGKHAIYAAQIQGEPLLLEPVYRCDVAVAPVALEGVYNTLRQRRAIIEGGPEGAQAATAQVRAFLPVLESFGFTEHLRKNTSGQAFPQMVFSHWQPVKGDPYDESSHVHRLMMDIRKRKGLKMELPKFADYNAKDLAPPKK